MGVAIGAFGDSFGLPSSGEIVLLLASAASAASASRFGLPVVIAVAWGFAVIGDATAYAIGRAAGPRVLHRFGVHEDSAVHGFMDRHGARAVAAGRLVSRHPHQAGDRLRQHSHAVPRLRAGGRRRCGRRAVGSRADRIPVRRTRWHT